MEKKFPFKVITFGVRSLGPVPLLLLEASLEFPFRDAVQHCLQFGLNLSDIIESSSL
jgi:hypothetical protein